MQINLHCILPHKLYSGRRLIKEVLQLFLNAALQRKMERYQNVLYNSKLWLFESVSNICMCFNMCFASVDLTNVGKSTFSSLQIHMSTIQQSKVNIQILTLLWTLRKKAKLDQFRIQVHWAHVQMHCNLELW